MITRKKILFGVIFAAIITLLVACDPDQGLPPGGGTYDGFLITRTKTPEASHQTFVEAVLKVGVAGSYELDVTPQNADPNSPANPNAASNDDSGTLTFSFKVVNDSIALTWTDKTNMTLKSKGDHCFETDASSPWARFCYTNLEVSLDFKDETAGTYTTLIIDPRSSKNVPVMEAPAAFTKNQLLAKAINQSFSSRIGFERVVQANLNAKLQVSNLLPHFGASDLLNMASPSMVNFFKSVGDLMPFLLPDRWIKASEAKNGYDAQLYGWLTMKADAGSIVEGLVYTLLSQQDQVTQLQTNRKMIEGIRDQIKDQEKSGLVQIGTSDDITAVMNTIDQTVENLSELQAIESTSLAQASGFYNPHAISAITETQDPVSVDNPQPLVEADTRRLALERSYELKQFDSLLEMSQKEKSARFFNWMDPNGDGSGEIGLGLPSYIKIGSSLVRQLALEREQEQSLLDEKVSDTLAALSSAQKQWTLAQDGKTIQERRIARLTENMALGINYASADLVTALQGKVQNDLGMTEARYSYLLYWARLNRLLYAGPYADLGRGKLLSPDFDSEVGSDVSP